MTDVTTEDRHITGIVYSVTCTGTGGPTSYEDYVTVSPDGTATGAEMIYLTAAGSNEDGTVTAEQLATRIAIVARSYCLRLPLTVRVRGPNLPVIMDITMTV